MRARVDLAGRSVEPDWKSVFPNGLEILPLIGWFWRWLTGAEHRPYRPQRKDGPLHGWRLDDGHDSHRNPNLEIDMSPGGMKEIAWMYEGSKPCGNKILPEDKLGRFERRFLQKDQEFAKQIEISNNGWVWFKKKPKHSPRHSHTL